MFRKTGGFSFLISVILSMEDALSTSAAAVSARQPWDKANKADIFDLLKTILHTIVISMRYEPANAKFFEVEVKWMTLCAALKRVGCFDASRDEFESRANSDFVRRNFDLFESIFTSAEHDTFSAKMLADCTATVQVSPSSNHEPSPTSLTYATSSMSVVSSGQQSTSTSTSTGGHHQAPSTGVNAGLIYACYILRYLYETALDTFDK